MAAFIGMMARWLTVLVGSIEFAAGLAYLSSWWLTGNARHGGLALAWLAYGVAVVGLYLEDQ
jgi:hypothetical protein